jgi:hypothetical protein
MEKINDLLNKRFQQIAIILLIAIFVNTCGSGDVKSINKRLDKVEARLDSCATIRDIKIEGLKSEKRMIQSADRKILDVNRQTAIDTEITKLESEKK